MTVPMTSIHCPSCNTVNAANARFCTNCGASLTQTQSTPYATPHSQPEAAMIANFAFAGFWKRFIAYILDTILFVFIFAAIAMSLGTTIISSADGLDTGAYGFLAMFGIYILYYPCWWLYFALMESSSAQATLGKKLIGIKVTDLNGQAIGFGHALGRQLSGIISQFIFYIGYLLAAFTARKQALHDMIASTLVVNARYDANQIKVASQNPGSGMSAGAIVGVVFLVLLIPIGGILAAIALPAYQDYTLRAKVHQAIVETTYVQEAITEHAASTGYWPKTFQRAGLDKDALLTEKYHVVLANEGSYHIIFKQPEILIDSRIAFTPVLTKSGDYAWECKGIDVKVKYLPTNCR